MKKLLLILMALVLAVAMIACTNNQDAADDGQNNENIGGEQNSDANQNDAAQNVDLKEFLNKVIDGITPEELALDTVEINAELFPSFFFVDAPADEFEAYVSMPFIGSIAHQVAIVRVSEGTDVATLASEMETNLDPRKWVCAEAEKTAVLTKGNIILVVMSTADVVDAAIQNFVKL